MNWSGLKRSNKKGQATTELAIMGTIVLMLLGYLLQQGFTYNTRQALEMYTFRKALQLSQKGVPNATLDKTLTKTFPIGVNLTVIRDVIAPSFFSGISRQRLMATSSVEQNPYILYTPKEKDPADLPTRQFLQAGEAMIRNGYLFEIPPTKVMVATTSSAGEWLWTPSSVSEIDPQTESTTKPVNKTPRTSHYTYLTTITENSQNKTTKKELQSQDNIPTKVTFEDETRIKTNYTTEDWDPDNHITAVNVAAIPNDVTLTLQETVARSKNVVTAH